VTLEWTIPSPPPQENFEEIPTITHGPYDFESQEAKS
jgi:cytochrome c oxidase subunit 1